MQAWRMIAALIKAGLLIHRAKEITELSRTFRTAQKQEAAWPQGKMKDRKDFLLGFRFKINQQIPARNQVQPGKGRVAQQVMDGKGADIANGLRYHPARTGTLKKAFQAFWRHRVQLRNGVITRAGDLQRFFINICREYLYPGRAAKRRRMFTQQHRNGIGFFACGAARYPDAHGILGTFALEQGRNYFFGQRREGFRIAEEIRHIDQQIAQQLPRFLMVRAKLFRIIGNITKLQHLHPALHAAQETTFLIAGKIMAQIAAENIANHPARGLDACIIPGLARSF